MAERKKRSDTKRAQEEIADTDNSGLTNSGALVPDSPEKAASADETNLEIARYIDSVKDESDTRIFLPESPQPTALHNAGKPKQGTGEAARYATKKKKADSEGWIESGPPEKHACVDLDSPSLYNNRELGTLEFNQRVLALARDKKIPLLERLRYLCICSNNLDEFFEIRVAGLQQQKQSGSGGTGPDCISPAEQLEQIAVKTRRIVKQQYKVLNNELLPALAKRNISFPRPKDWSKKTSVWARQFFEDELLPVLSPLGLDPAHPFPQLTNKSLNFIVELSGVDAFGRAATLAVVRAPRSLPRIIPVPAELCGNKKWFVLLSTMIQCNMPRLFPGLQTQGAYQFRVTRNSDLFLADDDVADLRLALQDELNARDYGHAVRLEVEADCPPPIVDSLLQKFKLEKSDLYLCNGPVNLSRLQKLPDMIDSPKQKFPPFFGIKSVLETTGGNIFSRIRKRDVILHYPYESSDAVVALLNCAAQDHKVLAIKQTFYRTGAESAYADALIEAAHNGKDVTAIIELRARFDEKANIALAARLQRAGVQVVYGVVGYKTHAKMILIVRREKGKLVRYAHVGTGNYHQGTSRFYTDINVVTANKQITSDVQKVFNQLSGLGKVANLKKLLHAPFTMHQETVKLIEEQTQRAISGKTAAIKARMNSLTEPRIIKALYRASNAGVKIKLLVRGICALKPGIKGVSANIEVYSVLGRFLEHSRVYVFGPASHERVYLSSADWMPRNMFHRVEIAVPVIDRELSQRVIHETLDCYFADNQFSWVLQADGSYKRRKTDGAAYSAQQALAGYETAG